MPSAPSLHISDLVEADEARRRDEYQRAWKAYDGEGPKPLEVGDDGIDNNIRIDYPALIVDKGVSFLVGKGGGVTLQAKPPVELEAEESGEGEEEPPAESDVEAATDRAQERLDDVWTPEKRAIDLHELATNGGVCGHFWVRLYEDGRVSVLDPGNCSVDWHEDDVSIVKRYRVEWNTVVTDEEGLEEGVLRRWRIEPDNPQKPASWTIWLEEHDDEASGWREIDETAWPYDFAPIVEGQNLVAANTAYGTADLKPAVLDMVEQLESVASDMRAVVRMHGHPIPVVIGEDMSKLSTIDVAIGKLLAIPAKEGKLTQLQVAELTSSLELFRELKTALLEAARIPKIALGETSGSGPTTGVALKVEYAPLVEKTETKRLTYGLAITEIARRIFHLVGVPGWSVTLSWPDPMPADPKADAEADEAEIRMRVVSRQTVAERRGYDWETEQQRMAEDREGSAEALAKAFNDGEVDDDE